MRILEGFDSVMLEESQVCEGSLDKSDRTWSDLGARVMNEGGVPRVVNIRWVP